MNADKGAEMTEFQLTEIIKKLKERLTTNEGKASLKAAGEKSAKAAKDMEGRCKITDEMLRMRVTI